MSSNSTEINLPIAENISECIILQPKEYIPWNNTDNIISFETIEIVKKLKDLVFLPIMFFFGVPANVINMAVFYKQGLRERINVCLFALSFADSSYLLIHMLAYGEYLFYLHFNSKNIYGPVIKWLINHYLVGLYAFGWVSQVISAIVASERCFCILQPLKSQTVLRTSTMTGIIVAVFIVVLGGRFLVATRFYMVCAYDPVRNSIIRTVIGTPFYYKHKKMVDFLDAFMFGVGLPWVVIVVIVTTTIITVIKLRQAAQWRSRSSFGMISAREIALTRMLVGNSILFIVCVFPVGFFRFALLFVPQMNSGGRHHNLFHICTWLLHVLTYINSSFNILIYYTMGSRYRETFWDLLGRSSKQDAVSKTSSTGKTMSTGM